MTWNFDMSAAPRDGRHVILAMPNKTTLRSYWCKPKHDPEHWCMLSHKNQPEAWMPWPEHPHHEVQACSHVSEDRQPVQASASADHRVGRDHEGGTTGRKDAPAANPVTVASMSELPILEDVGGGVETMIAHHQQLFRHDPDNGVYGDCFRTVIACLLDKSPESVPHFCNGPDDGKTDDRVREYLRPHGLVLLGVNFNGDCDLAHILMLGEHYSQGLHYLLTGTTRNGTNHVVICKGREIIHDPSIDQSGIVGPTRSGLWLIEWLVKVAPHDQMEIDA
jgi:hypothetical protein